VSEILPLPFGERGRGCRQTPPATQRDGLIVGWGPSSIEPNDAGSEADGSEEVARRLFPRVRLRLPANTRVAIARNCLSLAQRLIASAQSKPRVRNRYCLIYRLAQAETADSVKLPSAALRSDAGIGAVGV
jgi:hypothetical protein